MGEEDRRCDVDMAAAAEEDEEKVVEMEMEEGSRVREWEAGLPGADDLMPLSQLLIPPELANAFSVSPEPRRSSADVHSASRHTLSSIRRRAAPLPFPGGNEPAADEDGEEDPGDGGGPAGEEEEESRKTRREDSATTTDDAESESGGGGHAARAAKRPRLVWTPQLHKRFVDVVTHLGIKKAVPKTIMQLMNVEGLTRENVASHLQKYRLYLKRQGLPYDGASTSDYSQSGDVDAAAGMSLPVPMQHGPPLLPMQSMNHHPSYHGFHSHPFGSMVSYPHAARRGRSEDDIGYPISQ